MTCRDLTEDLLLDLVRGDLPPDRGVEVRAHAGACPECAARLADTTALAAAVDRAGRTTFGLSPDRLAVLLAHASAAPPAAGAPPCAAFTEDVLLELALGELEPERAADARTHLDACAPCRARYEETRSLVATVDRVARRPGIGLAPERIGQLVNHAATAPVTCGQLTEDVLLDLARGDLALDATASLRLHLDACASCRARYEETGALLEAAGRAGRKQETGLAPDRLAKVLAHAASAPASGRRTRESAAPAHGRSTERLRRTRTVPMALRRRSEPSNVLPLVGGLAAAAAVLLVVVLAGGSSSGRRSHTRVAVKPPAEAWTSAVPDVSEDVVLVPESDPIPERPEPEAPAASLPQETFTAVPRPAAVPALRPAVAPPPEPTPEPLAARPAPPPAPAVTETRPAAPPTVAVALVTGDVRVLRDGATTDGRPLRPGDEVVLGPGDRLAADGVARLTVGYRHKVWLNSGARAGARRDGAAIRVSLAAGDLFADVISSDGRSEVFGVETPHGTVHVRGTRFEVRAGSDRTAVTVAEGTVVCRSGRGEVAVREGFQSELRSGASPQAPKPAGVNDAAGWMRALESYVWIEADGVELHDAESAADAAASGGRCARVTGDGGIVVAPVRPSRGGLHRLWARVRNGAKAGDYSARLNDGPPIGLDSGAAGNEWRWISGPVLDLPPHEAILQFWLAGKAAAVDRFLLTTDAGFQPRDEAPPATKPREGAAAPAAKASQRIAWTAGDRARDAALALVAILDGPFTEAVADGAASVRAASTRPDIHHYLYFKVSDRLWRDRRGAATVRVTFQPAAGGDFHLEYDSADAASPFDGTVKRVDGVDAPSAAPGWTDRAFTLPDARFANRQNGGCDFRIAVPQGREAVVRSVTVEW